MWEGPGLKRKLKDSQEEYTLPEWGSKTRTGTKPKTT